jgi:hypothetical protein
VPLVKKCYSTAENTRVLKEGRRGENYCLRIIDYERGGMPIQRIARNSQKNAYCTELAENMEYIVPSAGNSELFPVFRKAWFQRLL